MRNTLEHGGQLLVIGIGWLITNITMSTVIGIITAVGGLLYACNQGYLFWQNMKKRK